MSEGLKFGHYISFHVAYLRQKSQFSKETFRLELLLSGKQGLSSFHSLVQKAFPFEQKAFA